MSCSALMCSSTAPRRLFSVSELADPEICFSLSAKDFARVNPNTGTVPIFRSKRDADLTTVIYGNAVPLVNRSSGTEVKAWPVKYVRMFDMTNDSGSFRTRNALEDQESAYPLGGNTLHPAAATISPGQQDALAGNEGMAQTQTRAGQETAILPSRMGRLTLGQVPASTLRYINSCGRPLCLGGVSDCSGKCPACPQMRLSLPRGRCRRRCAGRPSVPHV